MLKKFGAVLYIIPLMFFGQTVSACVTTGNEALKVYCFVNELEKQPVSRETATEIDKKLKSQGYKNGLGLGFKNSPEALSVSVSSSVSFDSNLNGGNPKGPLILGGLTFQTDPNLEKKSGVLIGGQIDTEHRKTLSEGKYISINAGVSRLYNAEHNLIVGSEYGKICSINHIKNWWYLDACATRSHQDKALNSNNTSNYTLSTSKIFGGNKRNYSAFTSGFKNLRTEKYTQDQLRFGYEILNPDGWNFGLNVTFGEAVENVLTLQNSVEISYTRFIGNKPLKINLKTTNYSGSKLFGYERSDRSRTINLSIPLTQRFIFTIGVTEMNSSIDYYDSLTPIFGFRYQPS